MDQRLLQKILDGDTRDIPPLCLIKDYEKLRFGDEIQSKWKLIDGLKNINVEVLSNEQANKVKSILNMKPALTLKGLGTVFVTPDNSFYKKFKGQKNNVLITI